jgi:hypothetical protein
MKSVTVSFPSTMGRVRLDIRSTGELSWASSRVDEALEYERAFAAMGGTPSPLLAFVNQWETNIREAMFGLLPKRQHQALFAMDCAEHAARLYLHDPRWVRAYGKAIEASQRCIMHFMSLGKYTVVMRDVFYSLLLDNDPVTDVEEAAESLLEDVAGSTRWSRSRRRHPNPYRLIVVSAGEDNAKVERPASVSVRACRLAAAMGPGSTTPGPQNPRWRDEKAWQIRRFVDVLPAARKRYPWPGLKETP